MTLPPAEPAPERRRGGDRRASNPTSSGNQVVAAVFAVCGALVVLYLFLLAVGGISPHDAPATSVAALILAVLWLAYSGRRLLRNQRSPVGDRERRGF